MATFAGAVSSSSKEKSADIVCRCSSDSRHRRRVLLAGRALRPRSDLSLKKLNMASSSGAHQGCGRDLGSEFRDGLQEKLNVLTSRPTRSDKKLRFLLRKRSRGVGRASNVASAEVLRGRWLRARQAPGETALSGQRFLLLCRRQRQLSQKATVLVENPSRGNRRASAGRFFVRLPGEPVGKGRQPLIAREARGAVSSQGICPEPEREVPS